MRSVEQSLAAAMCSLVQARGIAGQEDSRRDFRLQKPVYAVSAPGSARRGEEPAVLPPGARRWQHPRTLHSLLISWGIRRSRRVRCWCFGVLAIPTPCSTQLIACLSSYSCLRFPLWAFLRLKPLSFYLQRTRRPGWINGEGAMRLPYLEAVAAGETRCVWERLTSHIVRSSTSHRLCCVRILGLKKLVNTSQYVLTL